MELRDDTTCLPSSYSWTEWLLHPFPRAFPRSVVSKLVKLVDAILMMSYDGVRVDGITSISPRMITSYPFPLVLILILIARADGTSKVG